MPSGNLRKRPEDKWIELLDYIDDLSKYLTNRVFTVQQELAVLNRTIDALPAREQTIIRKRYILGMEWNKIIEDVPLSERSVYNAHNNAIKLLNMEELDKLETICV